MATLTKEGRYKAVPFEWGLKENQHGTLELFMNFNVVEWWNGNEWQDVAIENGEMRGYFYLSKKDGNLNEPTIKSLREALGWDGKSLETLQTTNWSNTLVQITTALDEYKGEKRLRIKYINHADYAGQKNVYTETDVKNLSAKWGPKLRAIK